MISTFHGIETGKRGLNTHQTAMNVVGDNIANSANPIHSRRRIQLKTTEEYTYPSHLKLNQKGQLGTGVKVALISRMQDKSIENKIIQHISKKQTIEVYGKYMKEVEVLADHAGETSIKASFQNFVDGWNELSKDSSESSTRDFLIKQTRFLTERIQSSYEQKRDLLHEISENIKTSVAKINTLAENIAVLNNQITRILNEGDQANALMDQRDELVRELAQHINVQATSDRKNGKFLLFVGSEFLVQHDKVQKLEIHSSQGKEEILWENSRAPLMPKEGEIKALLDIRDNHLKKEIQNLNFFSVKLIMTVNALHKEGHSLNGKIDNNFFLEKLASTESFLFDNDKIGEKNYVGISEIQGSESLNREHVIGEVGVLSFYSKEGNIVEVAYQEDETVGELLDKINQSDAEVVAYLNPNNQLVLTTNKDSHNNEQYALRYMQDTGIFLTQYAGILNTSEEAFNWKNTESLNHISSEASLSKVLEINPASWIQMSPEIVKNTQNIAAAYVLSDRSQISIGNGNNAARISSTLNGYLPSNQENLDTVHHLTSLTKENENFYSFLDHNAMKLAHFISSNEQHLNRESLFLDEFTKTKHSISGINLDEEAVDMISHQHAYNASAKFVRYLDEMIETLLKMT